MLLQPTTQCSFLSSRISLSCGLVAVRCHRSTPQLLQAEVMCFGSTVWIHLSYLDLLWGFGNAYVLLSIVYHTAANKKPSVDSDLQGHGWFWVAHLKSRICCNLKWPPNHVSGYLQFQSDSALGHWGITGERDWCLRRNLSSSDVSSSGAKSL